jgi:hypothetical protein
MRGPTAVPSAKLSARYCSVIRRSGIIRGVFSPNPKLASVGIKQLRMGQSAAIRKGKKDIQAGRIVFHEKTARWLRSWGKKHELPPPSCE